MLTRADIYEAQGHLVVESDLPGVAEEDVFLRISKDHLRIEFRRRAPNRQERTAYFRQERIPGSVFLGIGLASLGVLMAEVLLTRIFSFSIWYHLAYLTLSTALLGFGAAGQLLLREDDGTQAEVWAGDVDG